MLTCFPRRRQQTGTHYHIGFTCTLVILVGTLQAYGAHLARQLLLLGGKAAIRAIKCRQMCKLWERYFSRSTGGGGIPLYFRCFSLGGSLSFLWSLHSIWAGEVAYFRTALCLLGVLFLYYSFIVLYFI